jgi:hypothetical protein
LLAYRSTPVTEPTGPRISVMLWWPNLERIAPCSVSSRTSPALRAGCRKRHPGQDLCAALRRRQVGSKEWSS